MSVSLDLDKAREELLEEIGIDDELDDIEPSLNPEGVEDDVCLVMYDSGQVI